MERADEILNKKQEEVKKALDPITNPKKQKGTFQKKLAIYNKPIVNVIVGFIMQVVKGMIGPTFGAIMQACLFSMQNPFITK